MDLKPNDEIISASIAPTAETFLRIFNALDEQTLGDDNTDYKRLYFFLFNGITDIIEGKYDPKASLMVLQSAAEELYLRLTEND